MILNLAKPLQLVLDATDGLPMSEIDALYLREERVDGPHRTTSCDSLLLDEGAWNQRTALKEIYVVLN